MAYNIPWNESSPPGSADADTLETEIQNLKESIRERIEDVVSDWANDAVDPKSLILPSQDRATVALTSDLAIPNTTTTIVDWDQEYLDDGGLIDLGTNPSRITIQEDGFYLLFAHVAWEASATGIRRVTFLRNGGTTFGGTEAEASGSSPFRQNAIMGVEATASTYFELQVYQSSGGNLDLDATLGNNVNHFTALKIL